MTTEAREGSHDLNPHDTYDMFEAATMADPDPPIKGLCRLGSARGVEAEQRQDSSTNNPG